MTTEFLARHIFMRLREATRDGELGPRSKNMSTIKVTLRESQVAWAGYEGEV